MSFTNEARLEQVRIVAEELKSATFKVGSSPNPNPSSVTDTRNVNGGMSTGGVVQSYDTVTVESDPSSGTIRVNCLISESEGNGFTWTEIGLFWASGNLISREPMLSPEIKNNAKRLFYTFNLDFYT